jgi:nicotinamide riboside kinase
MTKVINLFGGSGSGKSTLAAGLFHAMKVQGLNVELVTEFIKGMAWEGVIPSKYDQPYIFGNQSKNESRLYGKVDYVITDSPLLLGPVYEQFYTGESLTETSVLSFLDRAKNNKVEHINFFLERYKPFNPAGRFETEDKAKEIDGLIKTKLVDLNTPFININKDIEDKIQFILQCVLSDTHNKFNIL